MLAIIGKIGTAGGTGYTIEFAGSAIRALSMEGRMTVCNMAIEAGARAGLVAVDEKTIAYVKGRPLAPTGVEWDQAVRLLEARCSPTPDAHFDTVVELDAAQIMPQVTWGTSPEMVLRHRRPRARSRQGKGRQQARRHRARADLHGPGARTRPMNDIFIDKVFIGSCTNSRIEDMREAAAMVKKLGQKVAKNVKLAMVVPGSGLVKEQAEREGLDQIFKAAGFEWREPGCSMCLAMNADRLEPGERCASTSNRNFEGRQGAGGRTHLVSPAMAAAAAVHGHFVDVRTVRLEPQEPAHHAEIHRHKGLVAPMDRENVDTDAIIPKQFLKSIRKTGFGPNLFDAWRYLDPGEPGQDPASAQAQPGLRAEPAALRRAPRSCWRARTSAAAPRANTRPGRWTSTAFAPSSRRATPTSSSTTASRTACCRSC